MTCFVTQTTPTKERWNYDVLSEQTSVDDVVFIILSDTKSLPYGNLIPKGLW